MYHHRQTTDLRDLQPRASDTAAKALDYLAAAAIGTGLAWALVQWWTA